MDAASTQHSTSSTSSRLVDLPSELLHRILIHLDPFDLSRLSQTCSALSSHINSSNHLWKQVFEARWDAGSSLQSVEDPVLTEPLQRRRGGWKSMTLEETKGKGKGKEKEKARAPSVDDAASEREARPRLFLTDEETFAQRHDFGFAEQVKRRAVARKTMLRARERPVEFISSYNQTLRTLLAIARSRKPFPWNHPGGGEWDDEEVGDGDNEIGANANFLRSHLTSQRKEDVFRTYVYPRRDIRRLKEWQLQYQKERFGKGNNAESEKAVMGPCGSKAAVAGLRGGDHGEKRDRSSSGGSQGLDRKTSQSKGIKRQRISSKSLLDAEGNGMDDEDEEGKVVNRRRSTRLALKNYPSDLQHLLYEHRASGNGPNEGALLSKAARSSGAEGLRMGRLEDVETVDEQLAAELHVLHGTRPGRHIREESQGVPRSDEGREEDEESDFDEAYYCDPFDHADASLANLHEPPLGSYLGLHGDNQLRGAAREIVYDNARYGPETSYGPLRPWRERCLPLDGRRFVDRRRERELEEEGQEQQEAAGNAATIENDGHSVEVALEAAPEDDPDQLLSAGDEGDEHVSGDNEDTSDEEDGGPQIDAHHVFNEVGMSAEELIAQLTNAGNSDYESDSEYQSGSNSDTSESDDSEAEFFFEIRETAIAVSQGLLSHIEAQRLKNAMIHHGFLMGSKGWRRPTMTNPNCSSSGSDSNVNSNNSKTERPVDVGDSDPLPWTSTRDVWRMEKRVDWVTVEAIMIVMYCNIRHAVLHHGWGTGFHLPKCDSEGRSLMGRDPMSKRVVMRDGIALDCQASLLRRWFEVLCPPCGWAHSRGSLSNVPQGPPSRQREEEVKPTSSTSLGKESARSEHDTEKPFDWANVESTWIGTYAFLDWSRWASFNARDPISRGLHEESGATNMDPTKPRPVPITPPSLKREREAVGDCLQLRLELLPLKDQAKPFDEQDRLLEELERGDDEDARFPRLRFRGRTITFDGGPDPTPRGEVYGMCRPIYATADEEYYREREAGNASGYRAEGDTTRKPRSIVAIHWDLVHRYDGEDRWSLSGVQAGPPGTRAPIYGIWGSSVRQEDTSPCGPWTYYMVSERPWKEVDRLLAEEQRMGLARDGEAF